MLDLVYSAKLAFSLTIAILSSIWLVNQLIEAKRDLHTISLNTQSTVESVRKEKETAIYRNLLVPTGFPLTTGLNLSVGYRLRNGNFGDVWCAIMANAGGSAIRFGDDQASLPKINGIAKQLARKVESLGVTKIGIEVSVDSFIGFSVIVAGLMLSLKDCIPWFLNTVPRKDLGIGILFIENWESVKYLNGSEKWYTFIIVCDLSDHEPIGNIMSLKDFIESTDEDQEFLDDPTNSSLDAKTLAYVSIPSNVGTTSFSQMSLVSSISSFIKSFPLSQELSDKDQITICVDPHWKHALTLQGLIKLFSVLLHGGSASFIKVPRSLTDIPKQTTLLTMPANTQLMNHVLRQSKGIRTTISKALFSEGVFNNLGQISHHVDSLRCIYIFNEIRNDARITDFDAGIPHFEKGDAKRYSTADLTLMRSLFGTRVVMELYSPFSILGPLCYTNYYDYRVLPSRLDETVTLYGAFSTSLEGKLVETKQNPELIAQNRQGMLIIRGFTVGRPVEEERLEQARKLGMQFNGGDGWMPLLGVFGLFGNDGCFYEFK